MGCLFKRQKIDSIGALYFKDKAQKGWEGAAKA